MSPENEPKKEKTDEECFKEIADLLAEGWRFGGNHIKENQKYELVMSKKDENGKEEEKVFITRRPYPDIFDSTGKARSIS